MKQRLTEKEVHFPCGNGHIYRGVYGNNSLAIFVGEEARIGKISVNMEGCDIPDKLENKNQFFVKLYGTGEILNEPAFDTGLFKKVGKPFQYQYGTYEKWELLNVNPH